MLVPSEGNRTTYVVMGQYGSSQSPANSERSQRERPCESMEEGDRNSSGHFDLNKTVQADDFGKPSK